LKKLVTLVVNDDSHEVAVKPSETLLSVLREKLALTGAKHGCDSGKCGCCTVLVDGKAIRSCLTLAISARDKQITTIEGLARNGSLHPIQKAFIDYGAVQCGYCTPGIILFAKAFLEESPDPEEDEIREALGANICRCTGYLKIIEAIKVAARETAQGV
jgi:aerobic carbon-monoxide dehydrogenase small subunit